MPIVSLNIDEAHEAIHQKVGNRSALYRWALWEWHKGNPKAEKAADAPTTRRRPVVKGKK
jgi:hypothetical protein